MKFLATSLLLLAMPLAAQSKCIFKPTGTGCGPRLSASEKISDRRIATFQLRKAPANALGLLAAGVQELSITLPNKCKILVNPILLFPLNSNSKGEAARSFSIPAGTKIVLRIQAVSAVRATGALVTSNALIASCL